MSDTSLLNIESQLTLLPDGTINVDVSQVVFSVNWNQISDYDLNTGLMNINGINRSGTGSFAKAQPQESLAYHATQVISTFIEL